jgi:LmbE family N-acetylglucosaminyl deacetylase
MKKPVLVAIFAHPDDEAFGPAGTLAIYAKTHEVYIICVTDGEAGENHTDNQAVLLSEIRKHELELSASILGVEEVFFLNYKDGTLCNNSYHALAEDLCRVIDKLTPEILLTFEPRGVSGHLDHVAVSLVTHYVFDQKKYVKKLLNYALPRSQTDTLRDYFIYVPHGIEKEDAHLEVEIDAVWDLKVSAIKAHKSQQHDIDRMLESIKNERKVEYFLIEEKE